MRRSSMAVRVVGPTQWVIYPALLAVAATVILATPVRLFGLTLPEPVLPMVLAFAWPLIRPSVLAPLVLMLLGVFLSLFWGQRLGLWSLSLLAVYGAVLLSRSILTGQETVVLFVWYTALAGVAFLITYTFVTLLAGNAPSLLALLGQIIPTLLVFPLVHLMLERFDDGDVRFR